MLKLSSKKDTRKYLNERPDGRLSISGVKHLSSGDITLFDTAEVWDRDEGRKVYSRFVATKEGKLLVDMFPQLSSELRQLLVGQGESKLAAQVPALTVIERCRCGDDFRGMFYVLPKPPGAYGPDHRNVALWPMNGMLILDVVADKIVGRRGLVRGRDSTKTFN